MNIAFVSQPWEGVVPPVEGGSLAIWTYQVAQRCAATANITIYSRQNPGQEKTEYLNSVLYRRVSTALEDKLLKPLKLVERVLGNPSTKRPLFALPIYYRWYIQQIATDLKRRPSDIVHIWNFSQFVPVVRSALPKAKIVLHMQCDWLAQLDYQMIERRLRQVDLIVGCSDHVTQGVSRRFPHFANRCTTIYNGVDFRENGHIDHHPSQTAENSTKRLLFVGRVSPEKGIHVLLDAFKAVAAQRPEVHLDIVGPNGSAPFEFMVLISDDPRVAGLAEFYPGRLKRSNYEISLQKQIPSDLANRVNFVGHVNYSAMAEYYHRADILINPSLTEAFGMSLVEAMTHRLPVVASRIGGMTEIVQDDQTGLLVDAGDSAALANALLKLLDDKDKRKKMGQAGNERARSCFTWDQIADMTLTKYKELLG